MAKEPKPSAKKAITIANPVLPSTQQPAKRALAPDLLSGRPRHGMAGDAIVSSALEALQANRLRSFLTILGVIIGVAAVIAVVTLAQGVSQSINQRLAGLGTNLITISPGTATTTGARSAVGSAQTLTLDDAQALTQIAHVVNMSPLILTSGQVVYGNQNWNTTARGVYPVYQTMQNWQIAEGSWFSDEAEQTGAPVAVLGQTVVQNLFSASTIDPIGQTIRINSQLFRVVGTLQAKGSQGLSNTDDVIFVPFSAANERLKPSPLYVDQIQVQVDDVNNVAQVQQNITTLLRARHHLRGSAPTQGQQGSGASPLRGLGGGAGGSGGNPTRGFGGGAGGFGGGSGSGNPTRGSGSGSGSGSGGATTPRIGFASANVSTPNDFQVFNGNQLVQTAQQSTAALTILLIGIAAISLFVGGIGIMNIMLVSVSERTREIGIRMAIGARQRDIRNQFLLEALLLSITGGVLGILTGFVAGYALTKGFGGFPFVFSPIAVALAFTVSAIVGISFGYYPAVHAAKLDPVIALRME